MWTGLAHQLILASASPRRLEILAQLKIPCHQLAPPTHAEDEPRMTSESVLAYVRRTSEEKNARAQALIESNCRQLFGLPILSADTTVAIGEEILGKPVDAHDARRILIALSGHEHDVYCAVTLHFEGTTHHALSHSKVSFDKRLAISVEDYIGTGEPFGKAGAYGIQGIGAAYVRHLSGSYTGVMGLPAFETCQLLRDAGLWR